MLIEKCQEISAAQCIRVSFLSGDVHVCAAGRLYSDPKVVPLFLMPNIASDSHAQYFNYSFACLKIQTVKGCSGVQLCSEV